MGPDAPPPGKTSPKKNVIWESFESLKLEKTEEPLQALQSASLIKFNLSWTEDTSSTAIERPKTKPLQPLDITLANNTAMKPKTQG